MYLIITCTCMNANVRNDIIIRLLLFHVNNHYCSLVDVWVTCDKSIYQSDTLGIGSFLQWWHCVIICSMNHEALLDLCWRCSTWAAITASYVMNESNMTASCLNLISPSWFVCKWWHPDLFTMTAFRFVDNNGIPICLQWHPSDMCLQWLLIGFYCYWLV